VMVRWLSEVPELYAAMTQRVNGLLKWRNGRRGGFKIRWGNS
jgi:hypothetical protein